MAKIIYSFLIVILCLGFGVFAQEVSRPRVGLVLSGGGARGFAHIGTLKLLDSLQIPVDYIAGTSMGGIAGALYSIGYSGKEIEQIALNSDWNTLFSDRPRRTAVPYLQKKDDGKYQLQLGLRGVTPVLPSGLIQGQKASLLLANLISGAEGITDFDQLPIPYQCVAVDLITGNEVMLKKGPLAKAMRATMSIPTIFSPVEWGDSLLIDGGLLNNFPADVVKAMGADIIIGVNVGTQLSSKEELQSILSILNQTLIITDYARQRENMNLCDVLIIPDLKEFSTTDFDPSSIRAILQRGNEAARASEAILVSLKEQYNLHTTRVLLADSNLVGHPLIQGLYISGGSYYSAGYFYDLLQCYPNSPLDVKKLKERIIAIHEAALFKSFDVEIINVDRDKVRLHLKVESHENPILFGIAIKGNKTLPFSFIYRLLGIEPGKSFNLQLLSERIEELFALGYFERIDYEIEPVRQNFIRVTIHVVEKPIRIMRIGFQYDDFYKIVGRLGVLVNNFPLAGLRAEASLEFAGRIQFDYSLAYPSRGLNLPLFPYIRFNYKEIPLNIYDMENANKLTEYDDRSYTMAAGLAFQPGRSIILQMELNQEQININPGISGLDPDFFPSWKDRLRIVRGSFMVDRLDDVVLPRSGLRISAEHLYSWQKLGSDVEYQQITINTDFYRTFFRRHNLRLSGFYTNYLGDLPIYKYAYQGGPNSFIGMKYHQILGRTYGYGRLDYRYEYKKDIFLKLIGNVGYFEPIDHWGIEKSSWLSGMGLGIQFLSLIGPFEIIISRGSKSIIRWDEYQNRFYFTAGFYF